MGNQEEGETVTPRSPRGKKTNGVFAGDYQPPSEWTKFYIRLDSAYRNHYTARAVGGLSDEELAWVARVVLAELDHRQKTESRRQAG